MSKKRILSFIVSLLIAFNMSTAVAQTVEKTSAIEASEITGFVKAAGCMGSLVYEENDRPFLSEVVAAMPETLSVYIKGEDTPAEVPVTWESVGLDYTEARYYYYQFSPVLGDEYTLSEDFDIVTSAPYISVEFLFEDDYEVYRTAMDEIPSLGAVSSQATNEKAVFDYLTGTMKLNRGAACGIMANIYAESTFRPTASHTEANGSVSYGICQWNGSRKTRLEDYCSKNGYDYTTINGQLHYLEYELKNYYKTNVYTPIAAVEDSADGAYEAAYIWCVKFEIPANKETVGATRGNTAKNKFWPEYKSAQTGGDDPDPTPAPEPAAKITLTNKNVTAKAITPKIYTGIPYTPVPVLTLTNKDKSIKLVAGRDFTLSYNDNVEPGLATVKVTGNGNYEGELSFNYSIKKRDLKQAKIFADDLPLNGDFAPGVYVYYGNECLEEGKDYTVVEDENLTKTATKHKVVIRAVDDEACRYTGTKDVTISILQDTKMFGKEDISFADSDCGVYTGKAIKPPVIVTYEGEFLDAKNYSVSYKNNVNAGTGLVVITGKKDFKGKLYIPFEIVPRSGEFVLREGIKDQKYKGTYIKPKPQVLYAGKKLSENKDYYLEYSNNIGPSADTGNAEIFVKGIGNYSEVEDLTTGFLIVK